MKMNHELIRKYIRIVGIVFFIFVGFLKVKRMIDNGGKEEKSFEPPDDVKQPGVEPVKDIDDND